MPFMTFFIFYDTYYCNLPYTNIFYILIAKKSLNCYNHLVTLFVLLMFELNIVNFSF